MPEDISLKEWCKNPIYKKKFYDNLITYKLLFDYFTSNDDLVKIKKSSNLIEKWSKIIEEKNYFKIEHFKSSLNIY